MIDTTPLFFPSLAELYQTLAPWAEALLRAVVGLALVPHGLRMVFGFFPDTGGPIRNLAMMAEARVLDSILVRSRIMFRSLK